MTQKIILLQNIKSKSNPSILKYLKYKNNLNLSLNKDNHRLTIKVKYNKEFSQHTVAKIIDQ